MASVPRSEALALFKCLLRTAQSVFAGDAHTLSRVRASITEDFRKNAGVTDPEKLRTHLNHGWECEKVLREDIIQAELQPSGNYRLNIRKDTLKDNFPYRGDMVEEACIEKKEK